MSPEPYCLLLQKSNQCSKGLKLKINTCIGYKNIPVSIDDAPKAVQGERNVVTTISARSAQRI